MKKLLPAIGTTASLIILAIVSVFFYGVVIEPRVLLDVHETEASMPGLAGGWEGATVVMLADQQTGMWWDNDGMVEEAVEETLELKPDLILLGGDFIYDGDAETIEDAIEMAQPLAESGIPTFAVLGNHDYSMNKKEDEPDTELAAQLEVELERNGIRVLDNEAVSITRNGDELYVVGIGSRWAKNDDAKKAFADVPDDADRVVLAHNPGTWTEFESFKAPFTTSGHTHGGQLRLPFFKSESWLTIAKDGEVIADGWVSDDKLVAPGNRIYVNRGIGFSTIPMRLNCRPELTVFTLLGETVNEGDE